MLYINEDKKTIAGSNNKYISQNTFEKEKKHYDSIYMFQKQATLIYGFKIQNNGYILRRTVMRRGMKGSSG